MSTQPKTLRQLGRNIIDQIKAYLKSRKNTQLSTSTSSGPTFLNETPNISKDSLKFGHQPIVSALDDIINAATASMTIGLFGNWGSGKSSIVENLKLSLVEKLIPVIIFDVWKHDGDALRRTFLKDLDFQLSKTPYGNDFVTKLNILDKRVFSPVTISSDKIDIKYKKFCLNVIAFLFVSICILAPLPFSNAFLYKRPIGVCF